MISIIPKAPEWFFQAILRNFLHYSFCFSLFVIVLTSKSITLLFCFLVNPFQQKRFSARFQAQAFLLEQAGLRFLLAVLSLDGNPHCPLYVHAYLPRLQELVYLIGLIHTRDPKHQKHCSYINVLDSLGLKACDFLVQLHNSYLKDPEYPLLVHLSSRLL